MYSNALLFAGHRFQDPFRRKMKIRGLLTAATSLETQYLNIMLFYFLLIKIVM
jgi:hypothetical protein